MHLCDITLFYTPESGGIRRYLEAKRQWLAYHTRYRHSLLTPGRHKSQIASGIFTLPAPTLPYSNGHRFPLRQGPWIKQLIKLEPDLIEAEDPYRLASAAIEAGRQLNIPAVGFYHSDLPRLFTRRLGAEVLPLTQRYIRQLYSRFDLVLTPSQVMRNRLLQMGIEQVTVQPLGVDTEVFHPRHRDLYLRQHLGLDASTRLLIFAGRYAREKNLEQLVEAFSLLGTEYHLLLVGSEMPFSSTAHVSCFPHFVATPDLARLLASADALVHAGDNETFGLIVLEAMASGIPVVGVNAGAIPELVNPAIGTLATDCAPKQLAEAIEALFIQDIHGLGMQARHQAESYWTWDHAFNLLLENYHELLGHHAQC
ncbi:glycosyltransferase family 4 protein [Acidihalobacter prosperus]